MKSNFDLSGKKVLVTGGASGIGLATVNAFLRCGATVAINDLPGEKLDKILKDFQAQNLPVISAAGNIGQKNLADQMMTKAIIDLDGLDYLINNAGTPATSSPILPADFERQDEALWDTLLNVNLLGPFRCTKIAAPYLRESRGSIVNTASTAGIRGGGSSSAYCATKAALINLTQEWAKALAPDVRVNAIAPGLVDSEWMCRFEGTDFDVTSETLLQRQGSPNDYADTILYLAAGADYINGQTLVVDGGMGL